MRVENVKGAVWTVDDEEYYKRRPPRGVGSNASPSSNQSIGQSPTLTPQTPSIIDQVNLYDYENLFCSFFGFSESVSLIIYGPNGPSNINNYHKTLMQGQIMLNKH
jgi:hypothetical protein